VRSEDRPYEISVTVAFERRSLRHLDPIAFERVPERPPEDALGAVQVPFCKLEN